MSLAAQATAAEIARLITAGEGGRITIGERKLEPGDIAILVRTHAQGSEVKREFARLGIGSVEMSQASVFQTPDAEEVERVLTAINQPSRDPLLRGALATEMMGCDAAGSLRSQVTKPGSWATSSASPITGRAGCGKAWASCTAGC
jgi:exodeoxyribonuclease V beta subunit